MARARSLGVVVVAILVVAALVISRSHVVQPAPTPTASQSTDPKAWVLPSLNKGANLALHSYLGQPLVVDLFASWCQECKAELPAFAAIAQEVKGKVSFVGVDSEETGDGATFAQRMGIGDWPLARDIDGAASSGLHDALGKPGMPVTAFYSSAGALLYVSPGAMTGDEIAAKIKQLYGIAVTFPHQPA